jgi:hypothetical protein
MLNKLWLRSLVSGNIKIRLRIDYWVIPCQFEIFLLEMTENGMTQNVSFSNF